MPADLWRDAIPGEAARRRGFERVAQMPCMHPTAGYGTAILDERRTAKFFSSNLSVPMSRLTTSLRTDSQSAFTLSWRKVGRRGHHSSSSSRQSGLGRRPGLRCSAEWDAYFYTFTFVGHGQTDWDPPTFRTTTPAPAGTPSPSCSTTSGTRSRPRQWAGTPKPRTRRAPGWGSAWPGACLSSQGSICGWTRPGDHRISVGVRTDFRLLNGSRSIDLSDFVRIRGGRHHH